MKKCILFIILCSITTVSFSQSQKEINNYIEYSDWSSLKTHQVPEWFKDAKFGIYAHLGVYCVPAFLNEWYPNNMYKLDEKTGKPSKYMEHQIATNGSLKKIWI